MKDVNFNNAVHMASTAFCIAWGRDKGTDIIGLFVKLLFCLFALQPIYFRGFIDTRLALSLDLLQIVDQFTSIGIGAAGQLLTLS